VLVVSSSRSWRQRRHCAASLAPEETVSLNVGSRSSCLGVHELREEANEHQ
jgi:hypothetical protein